MSAHAKKSPSGASGWMRCTEWTSDSKGSSFANEGTAAHELASTALESAINAEDYLGKMIQVDSDVFCVDEDMANHVQVYIDYVTALGGTMMVEQSLSIEHLTGEAGAKGTSDAVVLNGNTLTIVDLKYGRGVKVDAEGNEQLQIYALAAYNEFNFLYDIQTVRMVIVQPRLNHVSEWEVPIANLLAFADQVKRASLAVGTGAYAPSEKACMWCSNKATCPALTRQVLGLLTDDVVKLNEPLLPQLASAEELISNADNKHLANCMSTIDLVEGWCKAVRGKVESELLEGRAVPGYKLVEGRRGARKWADESAVIEWMTSARIPEKVMYDFSLISPTAAEKLGKAGVFGPRQAEMLKSMSTQSEGKPSVAPMSDKRPEILSPLALLSEV